MLGDANNFAARLKAVLPKRWFSDQAPVLASVLSCFATPWAWLYGLLQFVISQTRILTATGNWLDLIASDFFGRSLPRKPSESDQAYCTRIRANLLLPRATRGAMISGLANLTGCKAAVFEPARPSDTGAYGLYQAGAPAPGSGLSYGTAGGWGSLNLPYQSFITVARPPTGAAASIAGYGTNEGGYGTGAIAYVSLAAMSAQVTDNDIESAVVGLLPVTATAWLRII